MKYLRTWQMSPRTRRAVRILGTIGTVARGLVVALVGILVIDAAVTRSPAKSRGIDKALLTLRDEPFGPVLLGLAALGLIVFGVYGLCEARWRRVLTAAARVAVMAHARKSIDGGLRELREVLAREGVTDPLWYEVRKSRKAPSYARSAVAEGADLIFVWGGDGTVQRCLDAVAGTRRRGGDLPVGTANLLATNLGVPATSPGPSGSDCTGIAARWTPVR